MNLEKVKDFFIVSIAILGCVVFEAIVILRFLMGGPIW